MGMITKEESRIYSSDQSIVNALGRLSEPARVADFEKKSGIKVQTNIIPDGHPNRDGRLLTNFNGIVVHYTANANPGATALANAKYFCRGWKRTTVERKTEQGIVKEEMLQEISSTVEKIVPFGHGSTQVLFDENSMCMALPFNERCHGAGDARIIVNPVNKNQTQIARNAFNNAQNFKCLQIEICNNGNWEKAAINAATFIQWVSRELSLFIDEEGSLSPNTVMQTPELGTILLLRHYDLTGKICPKPFVDDTHQWIEFVKACKYKC